MENYILARKEKEKRERVTHVEGYTKEEVAAMCERAGSRDRRGSNTAGYPVEGYTGETWQPSSSTNAPAEATYTYQQSGTSRTKLAGRNSLLVDLGSLINVCGVNTARELQAAAQKAGYEVNYEKRPHWLNVNGVGKGSAPCDRQGTFPIAVQYKDQPTQLDSYKGNIADGSGANLPAIMGFKSMQDKDAVLLLRDGSEVMAFPGPGGYKIEWSPGTKLLPMVPAPSGHLVIPCDNFETLPSSADGQDQMTFHTVSYTHLTLPKTPYV